VQKIFSRGFLDGAQVGLDLQQPEGSIRAVDDLGSINIVMPSIA